MLLFSKRLIDDGMNIIQSNHYDSNGFRDVGQNWKLLKGLELSGSYRKCLEFAELMCERAGNQSPLLHSLCVDSLIGSHCKLRQYKQADSYYKFALKNSLRIESHSFDKMIKLQFASEKWETVYSDMREKANEQNIPISQEEYVLFSECHELLCREWFLRWHARSYFFDRAVNYFVEKYRQSHSRFFFIDGNEIRMLHPSHRISHG